MAQIFPRSMNTFARTSIFGGVAIVALIGGVLMKLDRSPINTKQGLVLHQPVPFSHEHHYSGLGIDCRYCHTSVEVSAFAGLPPVQTCNNCHAQIWTNAEMLAPVRDGIKNDRPIKWARVHDLPDFVFFNHSIHVAKGVGCNTCHGPIDQMQLTYQGPTLQMNWCLDCHRNPEKFLRPKEEVFNMAWTPAAIGTTQAKLGPELVKRYEIRDKYTLTNCSTCHR